LKNCGVGGGIEYWSTPGKSSSIEKKLSHQLKDEINFLIQIKFLIK